MPEPEVSDTAREIAAIAGAGNDAALAALVERRVEDLIAYQSRSYAHTYADFVREVRERELGVAPEQTRITDAVARQLYKLMAYKDEYEVARLHLDPTERARIAAEFGSGARVAYNLHPPVLRALGLRRKLTLGAWIEPAFGILRRLKFLRGTSLDPFGASRVRRLERALPGEYRDLVRRALACLTGESYAAVLELCELPDVIRGYEDIKLRNAERFRQQADALLGRLEEASSASAAAA